MLDVDRSARAGTELIDSAALAVELEALAETYAGRERELRTAVAQLLKAEMTSGPRTRRRCC